MCACVSYHWDCTRHLTYKLHLIMNIGCFTCLCERDLLNIQLWLIGSILRLIPFDPEKKSSVSFYAVAIPSQSVDDNQNLTSSATPNICHRPSAHQIGFFYQLSIINFIQCKYIIFHCDFFFSAFAVLLSLSLSTLCHLPESSSSALTEHHECHRNRNNIFLCKE